MLPLELFKKALIYMLEKGEFEKLIECAPNRAEKKKIIKDRDMFKYLQENTKGGLKDFPSIPLVNSVNSVETFRDCVSIMAMLGVRENGGK